MKKVLLLHAWYNHPSSDWYPWLKEKLEESGFEVLIPSLPTMNSDRPDLAELLSVTGALINEDTIVIGHSLGGVLALRLAEKKKMKMVITVSAWDYDDLYPQHQLFWKDKINHEAIVKNVKDITVIHSDNDLFLTALQSENMSKRLKGKFILVKGAGHFTAKEGITEIPQILELL